MLKQLVVFLFLRLLQKSWNRLEGYLERCNERSHHGKNEEGKLVFKGDSKTRSKKKKKRTSKHKSGTRLDDDNENTSIENDLPIIRIRDNNPRHNRPIR